MKNALTGIALVFIFLALFLNFRVAFWVAVGIPFVFFGTVLLSVYYCHWLNLSLFYHRILPISILIVRLSLVLIGFGLEYSMLLIQD